uniref:Uncharacterized protein n=1 Tax=viral metagenome TaxID=1070528 RepID=A0A6H1Z976_9ZZZZ
MRFRQAGGFFVAMAPVYPLGGGSVNWAEFIFTSWEYSTAGGCNPEPKRPYVAPKTDDHGRILP